MRSSGGWCPTCPSAALQSVQHALHLLSLNPLELRNHFLGLRAVSKCIQISITCPDTEALTLLRDRINSVLLKCAGAGDSSACAPACAKPGTKPGAKQARRPLAPRSLNTLAAAAAPSSSAWGGGGGSVVTLRSGPGGGVAPAASGFSLGTTSRREALASSAESSAAGGAGEDLAALSEEQQRALALVRSGRSIFFTGEAAWQLPACLPWGWWGWSAKSRTAGSQCLLRLCTYQQHRAWAAARCALLAGCKRLPPHVPHCCSVCPPSPTPPHTHLLPPPQAVLVPANRCCFATS